MTIIRILGYKFAKNAEIFVLKCLDGRGLGDGYSIICALKWCIENDVHIINFSCGSLASQYESEFVQLGIECRRKGIMVFTACHDTGFCGIPAKLDGYIAVWGNSIKGRYSYYYDDEKDRFVANGGRQIVCWKESKYIYADGSSFATARMSGLAAKIIEESYSTNFNNKVNLIKKML